MARTRTGIAAVAAMLLLAGAEGAAGQDFDGFNTQNYRVPTDPHGYITMNGARTLRSLQIFAGVGANWAHNPLTFILGGDELIEDLTQLDLVAGVGLFEFGDTGGISVGVHAPIVLDLHGVRFDGQDRQLPSGGFGDIEVNAKATFLDREEDFIGVYGRMSAEFGSGEEEDFTSNKDKITLGWQIGVEKQFGKVFRIGVEVGYEWIDGDIKVGGVQVDDKFHLKGGAGLSIGGILDVEALEQLWAMVECWSYGRAGHLYERNRETPIEIGGALKYAGDFYAMLGGSGGLNRGVGAPDARLFLMIGFSLSPF